MTRRLAPLALLAGVLAAAGGPHDTPGRRPAARTAGGAAQVTSGRVVDLLPSWQPL
jgi:hypothetical protein